MAITEVLRLVLDADMRAGVTQVERFGDTAKRELGKSEQSLDRWGNRLTNVGAGMVGFGTAALFGLGKAAQASEEAQLSVVKLENTIANMPKLAGQSSKQFLDLADSIQDVTAADADAIVAGEAMLGTFGLTAEEIKGITPLVVDYARKFGTDLVTANTQVGKALDGSVGALKRNGVSIDENLFKTDRYAAVTQALRDQVGGFAEQEGRTFAGSLERLKNQMGDVVEGVGVGAVDAFGDLIGVVQPAIDGFNDFDPGVQSTIGKVGTFGSVALIAAGGASVLIGQVIKARENFSAAGQALSSMTGGMRGLARTIAVGGVVISGLVLLDQLLDSLFPIKDTNLDRVTNDLVRFTESGKLSGDAADVSGEKFEKLAGAIREVFDPNLEQQAEHLGDTIGTIGGIFETKWTRGLGDAKDTIDALDKSLADFAARDPGQAAAAFEAISKALRDQGVQTDHIKAAFDDYDAAVARADTSNRTAAGGIDKTSEELDEQATAAQEAKDALDDYTDKLHAMTDPLFGMLDAFAASAEAQAGVVAAQQALNDTMADGEATAADVAEAQAKLDDAYRRTGETALDVDVAASELNAAIEENPALVDAARSKLEQWVSQGIITAEQAAMLGAQFDTAAQKALNLDATDPTVRISESGAAIVTARIDEVKQQIDAIDGRVANVAVNFRTGGVSIAEMIRFTGARQHGGPVTEGDAFWVGEAGRPELFVPSSDGRIFTEQQVAAATGQAGRTPGPGGGTGGSEPVKVQITLIGTGLLRNLRHEIRTDHGGNAQVALGQG